MADTYRILVVEDDALIAMELGERLEEMGYSVLGPALTLEDAEALFAQQRPHAALLDANLDGKSSVELGAKLAAQGVPVAFCTGYDRIKDLPEALISAPVLVKPVGDKLLLDALKKLLS
ncbi:MAG: response regulator [Hyphomonadaceae bacterium]|nr:response regulator [Hyphomonadaceae bacterium]